MRETDSYKLEKIVYRKEQQLQTRLDVEIQKQLKRFRLDVKLQTDGGCLGILGPSGCGKSMTLKSIAGIVTPDEGLISIQKGTEQRILFDKSQKVNIKPQKRRIGYLFQNYALFPNMTVQENIAAGLAGDVKNPKVGEMIGRFGLSGLEKQYPGQIQVTKNENGEFESGIQIITEVHEKEVFLRTIKLVPMNLAVGIGCKKGKSLKEIAQAVYTTFAQNHLLIERIGVIASIDL